MKESLVARKRTFALATVVLFGTSLLGGCGLDEVQIPELFGPSEFAESLRLTATPDLVYSGLAFSDKPNTSLIEATLRDRNGAPIGNREIYFTLTEESGLFADVGRLGANYARTNGQGVATVLYHAPARTDSTANQSVLVAARPVGNDFSGQIYRTVRIELRSPEPRLFPQNPNNEEPLCNFVVETPSGLRPFVEILFQSTASDPDGTIVRYEWFWGDGDQGDKPDEVHVYKAAGTYTVSLIVTDDDGRQALCVATLPLVNN